MKKPMLKLRQSKENSDGDDNVEIDTPKKELSMKEQINKLYDPRKKAFYRYKKWKNSLLNEKNVKTEAIWKLLMDHNSEYQVCST